MVVALAGESVRLAGERASSSAATPGGASQTPGASVTASATPTPLALVPERHGPYLFVPSGWRGDLEAVQWVLSPTPMRGSNDTGEVMRSELWRDPVMPAGVTLHVAYAEALPIDAQARWYDAAGQPAFSTMVWRQGNRLIPVDVWPDGDQRVFHYVEFDGKPAVRWRTPATGLIGEIGLRVFDPASGIEYLVTSSLPQHSEAELEPIMRSLMR